MKLWSRNRSIFHAAAAIGWLFVCHTAFSEENVPKIQGKGFRYLIERHPDGSPKVVLNAAKLTVSGENRDVIEAADTYVGFYTPTGAREGFVTAETCRYDARSNTITSASAIHLQKGLSEISGTGLEWSVTQQVVRILHDVKVVIKRSVSSAGDKSIPELIPGMKPDKKPKD